MSATGAGNATDTKREFTLWSYDETSVITVDRKGAGMATGAGELVEL